MTHGGERVKTGLLLVPQYILYTREACICIHSLLAQMFPVQLVGHSCLRCFLHSWSLSAGSGVSCTAGRSHLSWVFPIQLVAHSCLSCFLYSWSITAGSGVSCAAGRSQLAQVFLRRSIIIVVKPTENQYNTMLFTN